MKLSIGSIFGSSKKKTKTRSIPRSAFGSSSSSSAFTPKTVLTGPRSDPDPFANISRRDLEAFLRRLGPDPLTDDELSSVSLAELRTIGSGPVDGSELREAFDVIDADGGGRISAEELLGIFESLGDCGCNLEECRAIIRAVDRDGDGFVGFGDFVRMMDLDGQRWRLNETKM